MRSFGRFVLTFGAASALLAGCGGTPPPIGASGVMPQSRAIATHAQRGGSWMLLEAKNDSKLVYATDSCGGSCVLSYPDGTLVGSLDSGGFQASGACTDTHGSVFISNNTSIVEYAHGGSSPIATLDLQGTAARGCAVDPTTGNLAVVFTGSEDDVAVFANATGTPVLYSSALDSSSCGYDDSGNLFVDGYNDQAPGLAELPKGGTQFESLAISNTVGLPPGQVQWDGKYITYESANKSPEIYRLAISGSTVNIVGTTKFRGIKSFSYLSWIYKNRILIPYSSHGANARTIGVWKYPQGNNAIAKFKHFSQGETRIGGVTLSVAPGH